MSEFSTARTAEPSQRVLDETMSLSLLSPPSANPNPNPLTSLLAKYDTALSLYDDLARDISQMKKATQLVRAKTLKLFERKVRRKKAFGIQNEALDGTSTSPRSSLLSSTRGLLCWYCTESGSWGPRVRLVLLAAGVKAQQRRRGTGPRKARPRRRDSTTTTASSSSSAKLGSPVKRRGTDNTTSSVFD